jgi:hypothetical protein
MRSHLALAAVAALAAVVAGCSSNCATPPCPFPVAAFVKVTSAATGAPITTASVIVNGDSAKAIPCSGTCYVPASAAGKYRLDISAPGFQPASRSITLSFNGVQQCGCSTFNQQQVDVALTPAAMSS